MTCVAVLRGGPSSEHDISLITGAKVLEHLHREPYQPVDIFIDKQGVWHVRGKPLPPERALSDIDVAWNAVHGQYGEEGTIQKILDRVGVPYTGAGAYASALSLNKVLTKEILAKEGIKMPRHRVLSVSPGLELEAMEAFRAFSPPVIVKPAGAGSSVGVTLAKTFTEFWEGVKKAFEHSREVLVEEYIKGKEATAGVVEGLRGQKYYAALPIEIIPPPKAVLFDREVKYNGETIERVPGNFTKEESSELQRLAKLAHEKLGLRHYSRSDFIVSPRGVYFLEANSAAGVGLTDQSLLPKSLAAAGISYEDFLDHIIQLALQK
ncbi:ATP-grasp domain-containing protein [Candidatus Kaiserbacteria bacterium]|nr:ATP-grasp domain-containing protein [Candidatus Kaiserbacteria bacterium]